jgi:hypothetical protein
VTHKVAVPLAPPIEDLTPDEQLLDEVCALEACAKQYENLWAAGRALTALGRLKERIPADMRARVVTTCLFAAASRAEDASWPALRARRDRARDALRGLRAIAPAELVGEIDELLATGEWNTQKRFPREAGGA